MKDLRLFRMLMTPSPSSFVVCCLFAALTLLASSWSQLSSLPLLAPYISGDYSFTRLFQDLNGGLSDLFSSNLAYNIAVIVFAIIFGISVYFVAENVRHMVNEAYTTYNEMEYASDERSRMAVERSVGLRVVLRAATAFVWFAYVLFFLNIIVPYCTSLVSKGQHLFDASPVHIVLAFVLLTLAAHLHVIFVRLVVLRPRLFGIEDVMVGRGGH
jgi:hypothetical protein